MKPALLLGLSPMLFATASAQPDTGRKPGPEMHARFLEAERSRATAVGRAIPEFAGVALNLGGVPFTQNQLRQRVTLMCFWYASCNCFKPAILDRFSGVRDPRFQIVSIMPDSFMYGQFLQERQVPGSHVLLGSKAVHELNFVGWYPTLMLIDGNCNVLKASRLNEPGGVDAGDWQATINGALMF